MHLCGWMLLLPRVITRHVGLMVVLVLLLMVLMVLMVCGQRRQRARRVMGRLRNSGAWR